MEETPYSNTKGKTNINSSKIKSKFGRGSIIRECTTPILGSCCGGGCNGGSGAATKITMKYSNN